MKYLDVYPELFNNKKQDKNRVKKDLKRVLKSIAKVLEANYPETYQRERPDCGFQKEKY